MKRRTLLKTLLGGGMISGLLGGFSRTPDQSPQSWSRERRSISPPVNQTPYSLDIRSRTHRQIEFYLSGTLVSQSKIPLTVVRREFTTKRRIDAQDIELERTQYDSAREYLFGRVVGLKGKVEFDPEAVPPDTPWHYVVYARGTPAEADLSYIGESDPLSTSQSRTGHWETHRASVVELPPTKTSQTYERRDVEGGFELEPTWFDGAAHHTAKLFVSKSAYTDARNTAWYGLHPPLTHNRTSTVLDTLLEAVTESDDDLSEAEQVRRVIHHVQGIPYATDIDSKNRVEHYRSGEDVLVEGCGDCEDTAFLLAGLLAKPQFGYRTAIGCPPGHAVALVHIDDFPREALEIDPEDVPLVPVGDDLYLPIETTSYIPIGRQWKDSYAYVMTETGIMNVNAESLFSKVVSNLLSDVWTAVSKN